MTKAQAVLDEALQLPPDDREWIATALIGSLEQEPGFHDAWRAELDRRWQSVLEGTAKVYDEDEADSLVFGPLDDE